MQLYNLPLLTLLEVWPSFIYFPQIQLKEILLFSFEFFAFSFLKTTQTFIKRKTAQTKPFPHRLRDWIWKIENPLIWNTKNCKGEIKGNWRELSGWKKGKERKYQHCPSKMEEEGYDQCHIIRNSYRCMGSGSWYATWEEFGMQVPIHGPQHVKENYVTMVMN